MCTVGFGYFSRCTRIIVRGDCCLPLSTEKLEQQDALPVLPTKHYSVHFVFFFSLALCIVLMVLLYCHAKNSDITDIATALWHYCILLFISRIFTSLFDRYPITKSLKQHFNSYIVH